MIQENKPHEKQGPDSSCLPDKAPTVGRSFAWLALSSLIQQGSALLLGIVLRSVLGPGKTGVWNLVEVWRQQLSSISLGASSVADREMPMLRAQGKYQDESEVRSIAFSFTMGEVAAVAIAFWGYWALAHNSFSPSVALGLALVPLLASLTSFVSIYQLFIKNQKQFKLFSTLLVIQAAIDWSTLGFVLLGGLDTLLIGLAAGWVLRAAIYVFAIRKFKLFTIKFTLRRERLVPMLKFGAMLSVWSLINQLVFRLDSLVLGTFVGTTALGFYYLGPQVVAALATLPTSLSIISFPNLMESYGRGGKAALLPHIERYLRVVALVISPIITGIGIFGIALLVRGFLPKFAPGLEGMTIYSTTLMFLQASYILSQALIALRRPRLLIIITIAALVLQSIVLGVFSIGGLNGEKVAWSAVLGQGLMTIFLLLAVFTLLVENKDFFRSFWLRIPIAWISLLTLGVFLIKLAGTPSTFSESILQFSWQLGAYLVAGGAIVFLLDRSVIRESRLLFSSNG